MDSRCLHPCEHTLRVTVARGGDRSKVRTMGTGGGGCDLWDTSTLQEQVRRGRAVVVPTRLSITAESISIN